MSYHSSDNEKMARCPQCQGKGEVRITDDTGTSQTVTCDLCLGSGRVSLATAGNYIRSNPSTPATTAPTDNGTQTLPSQKTPTLNLNNTPASTATSFTRVPLDQIYTPQELEALAKEGVVVCPACAGMGHTMKWGKRTPCVLCSGAGKVGTNTATAWRNQGASNGDRFKPRA